ncbi:MAG TPA: hypothetical protein VIO61_07600 [Anaerolineaceae bacterium]
MTTDSRTSNLGLASAFSGLRFKSTTAYGVIIIGALIAFELFNYSTTDFALRDLLGDLKFAGILWSTILAIAFCGIDFAGIARLFTQDRSQEEPKEAWYLFGAWMLAALMNAILTWWGVSMAIANHQVRSTSVIDPTTITKIVPVFVAVMVWVIRILIIGSLTMASSRIMNRTENRVTSYNRPRPASGNTLNSPVFAPSASAPRPVINRATAPASPRSMRPDSLPTISETMSRPEPTYHSLSARSTVSPRPIGETNTANRIRS